MCFWVIFPVFKFNILFYLLKIFKSLIAKVKLLQKYKQRDRMVILMEKSQCKILKTVQKLQYVG